MNTMTFTLTPNWACAHIISLLNLKDQDEFTSKLADPESQWFHSLSEFDQMLTLELCDMLGISPYGEVAEPVVIVEAVLALECRDTAKMIRELLLSDVTDERLIELIETPGELSETPNHIQEAVELYCYHTNISLGDELVDI